jgi:hypothetical protein
MSVSVGSPVYAALAKMGNKSPARALENLIVTALYFPLTETLKIVGINNIAKESKECANYPELEMNEPKRDRG